MNFMAKGKLIKICLFSNLHPNTLLTAILAVVMISVINMPFVFAAKVSDAAFTAALAAAHAAVEEGLKNKSITTDSQLHSSAYNAALISLGQGFAEDALRIALLTSAQRSEKQKRDAAAAQAIANSAKARGKTEGTGKYNPNNLVEDHRLGILGAAQNYCIRNGILMVGSQLKRYCNFTVPASALLPTIIPTPQNLIQLPGSPGGDEGGSAGSPPNNAPTFPEITKYTSDTIKKIHKLLHELHEGTTVVDLTASAATAAAMGKDTERSAEKAPPTSGAQTDLNGGTSGNKRGFGGNSGSGMDNFNNIPDGTATTENTSSDIGTGDLSDSPSGIYSAGSRGNAGSSGQGVLRTDSGGGLTAQGNTVIEFGLDASEGKTMLGDDPDDYFTRINIGESIFKIVSRRYQTKEKLLLLKLAK